MKAGHYKTKFSKSLGGIRNHVNGSIDITRLFEMAINTPAYVRLIKKYISGNIDLPIMFV
jgi:hypothetical protein